MLHISNEQLLSTVRTSLDSNGLRHELAHKAWSEKSMLLRVTFDDIVTISSEQFRAQLYLRNVNDGRSALRVQVGLYRLVCSNGLIMPAYDGAASSLRIVHRDCPATHELLAQLPAVIQNGLNAIGDYTDDIETMRETNIVSDEKAFEVIGNLNVSDNVKHTSMQVWSNLIDRRPDDQPKTAWSLYNIVNERIRLVHGPMSQVALKANRDLFSDVQVLAAA